ncbi:MAG: hypothetical protein ACI9FB_002281 [Candidatus Azotimanducaceae bacterium]|jgi:hypothetical protein
MYFIKLFICSFASIALAQPLEEEHEIVKLGLEEQRFEADYYFEKTGEPEGGIILTYSGEYVKLVSNLGYILSQHGWSVLIFRLAKNSKEIDTEPKSKDLSRVTRQLDAAFEFMEAKKNLYNLVLFSSGPSWLQVSRYLIESQAKTKSLRGLILHNAERTIEISNLDNSIAILDIATLRTPSLAYLGRQIHAKRFKMSNYQQLNLHLPQRQVLYGEDKLNRRIRGWLRTQVKGMKIEKKR